MQINYYQDASLLENYVDIHYREQDEEVRSLIAFLDAGQVITGRKEQISKRLFLKDIYYLEIVDRRCFAYLDKDVFQIDYSLKLFLEKYWSSGFVQIGKSLVVNLNRIDKISPDIRQMYWRCCSLHFWQHLYCHSITDWNICHLLLLRWCSILC